MPIPSTRHPRVPGSRSGSVERDLLLMQRAVELIVEVGIDLDQKLQSEARPSERLRFVREATNRITRAANDAILPYRRAKRALEQESTSSDGRAEAAGQLQSRLAAARLALLAALDKAGTRYPWTAEAPRHTVITGGGT
jgi:hypothetical protein